VAAHPGLRPVLFHSPYEGAAWAIISARRPARQAAEVRRELSEALGASFELAGERVAAFPLPEQLLEVQPVRGLPEAKCERLRGVARAALEGRLDPERLGAMEPEAAMAEMRTLKGIGPLLRRPHRRASDGPERRTAGRGAEVVARRGALLRA